MAAPNASAPSVSADRPDLDVTSLPPMDRVLEAVAEQLAGWMPQQRWYAGKGAGAPAVAVAGWAPLATTSRHLVLALVVRATVDKGDGVLYQVPIILRHPEALGSSPVETGSEIGVIAVHGGPLRVDDAARDAEGRLALLHQLVMGAPAVGANLRLAVSGRPAAEGAAPWPGADAAAPVRSRLLGGEQSNSSMIFEAEGARPLILKLFRVLSDGENPDVVLQGALSAGGCERVPAVAGAVRLALDDLRTHSAFAQEFLPGVEDAWRVAIARAAEGADFRGPARELGAALAQVHGELAAALGTVPADEAARTGVVRQMLERLDAVSAEVDAVAARRRDIERILVAAPSVAWPPLQRVHGDLHLGQVLAAPDRGWVLLDFEGEPLRPLAQRSLPDCPLRDVAGMLRSFDYAAGAVALERGIEAGPWAADARGAFLEGYAQAAGVADRESMAVLLAAFEADKAVYEALYEARNRPDWLPIPLAAIERIGANAPDSAQID